MWHPGRILSDVPLHGGETPGPHRLGTIAVRPEAPAPERLFQLRELLAQQVARAAFQPLHHLRHIFVRTRDRPSEGRAHH